MSNLHQSSIIAAAIGATIGVIGAATLLIYQKILEQRQQSMMNDYVENVDRRFAELEAELQSVRNQQKTRKARLNARKRVASVNSLYTADDAETDADAVSIAETETLDDEFYDCSDEELGGGDTDNGTPGTMRELKRQLADLDEKIENEAFHDEVLCDLRSLVIWHDDNVEVVWRLGRACYRNAVKIPEQGGQEVLLQEGIKACERVLDAENADLHKWYALLIGTRTEYLPIKEKLENGKRFEKHVKIALSLRPQDATLHHLIGRFKYSVSNLTWIEKKVCATLFGEVPAATFNEVITHLEEAERLSVKPDLENKYYLGMAYIKVKSYQRGIEVLKEISDLPTTKATHEKMKAEAASAISQYYNHT